VAVAAQIVKGAFDEPQQSSPSFVEYSKNLRQEASA
jgi:hypothetical protein